MHMRSFSKKTRRRGARVQAAANGDDGLVRRCQKIPKAQKQFSVVLFQVQKRRKHDFSYRAHMRRWSIHRARVLCRASLLRRQRLWLLWTDRGRKQQRATASIFPPFTGIERASCFASCLLFSSSAPSLTSTRPPKVNHLVKTAQKELPSNSCRHNDEQAPRALPQGLPQLSTALPRLRRDGLAVVCRRRRKL